MKKRPKKPIIIVLSGPTGTGKDALARAIMLRHADFHKFPTCTTRAPRPDEVEGREYYFVDEQALLQRKAKGEILAYRHLVEFGHHVGLWTPPIQLHLSDGASAVLDVTPDGALELQQHFGAQRVVRVFVLPPSRTVQLARIASRDGDLAAARLRQANDPVTFHLAEDADLIAVSRANNLMSIARNIVADAREIVRSR